VRFFKICLLLFVRLFKVYLAIFMHFFKILRVGIKIRILHDTSYFQGCAVYLQKGWNGLLFENQTMSIGKITGVSDVLRQ
jgi:hypothetical protein